MRLFRIFTSGIVLVAIAASWGFSDDLSGDDPSDFFTLEIGATQTRAYEMARNLVHGYNAATSYTDAQVGLLLDELDELGLRENTIVVLWGDHGWQLGEHGLWCKHCNFNTSLNAPLVVRAPGMKQKVQSKKLVEFIDVYPTLCELAGLPLLGIDEIHVEQHFLGRGFLTDPRPPAISGVEDGAEGTDCPHSVLGMRHRVEIVPPTGYVRRATSESGPGESQRDRRAQGTGPPNPRCSALHP